MSRRPSKKSKQHNWRFPLLLFAIFLGTGAFAYWISGLKSKSGSGKNSEFFTTKSALGDYAGSTSCRACHAEIFQQWETSHHALAERNISPNLDRSAFSPAQKIVHGSQVSQVRERDGKFELIAGEKSNATTTFPIERVIGLEPLRQFLIPAAGGRLQTAELAYDPAQKNWFDVFGNEDRRAGEWGHWTGRGMTWNSMCASCHNTRLQKNYDVASDTYATAMAEMAVGCESCHGPMKSHAQWQEKNRQKSGGDPTIAHFTRDQFFDNCGACHSRRSEITGDFVPGESFFDHHHLTIPDETDVFYPDGQVHDEDYEFTSFLSSKMHAAGVRCVDCHNPHSGKTKLPGNTLCLQCHNGSRKDAPNINPVAHSFHKADSAGNLCVSCHMPQTTYMQRHARRDHGFTIPDPLLTKKFNIPNACNRCHTDQSSDWALEKTESWYGEKMNRPTRQRAELLARARLGETNVVEPLLNFLRDEKIPLWRGSIVNSLRSYISDPQVTPALLARTSDPHPIVRAAAARAITPLAEQSFSPAKTALQTLLNDPVRSVRVEVAWGLRENLDTNSAAGRDLLTSLSHNADQPAGLLQLGHFFLSRNDLSNSLFSLSRAVSLDPNSPPFRHDYAVVLNLSGKNQEAISQLEAACRLAPNEPEYSYKLALGLSEAGRLREATTALEKTVKLNPQFSRAWYNLGLAYASAERLEDAVKALEKAEQMDLRSPEIPYARATVLARMRLNEEARRAAKIALQRDPNFSPAADFIR